MTTVLIAFILSLVTAVAMTKLVMIYATRFGILDIPDGNRKTHTKPTPLLGGVAIYVAMLAPIVSLILFPSLTKVADLIPAQQKLWGLLVGGSMALGLGVLDDIFSLRARWKLLWQIAIGVCVYFFGYKIASIANPFGGQIQLGILALPMTIFWFVACMNAVNLLDGMDGLAAGTSLFVGITLFNASLQFNNTLGMLLMGCFCGAVLGFLFFNFPPAKIFLGDSGSLLLGFLIAALSIVGVSAGKAETAIALFIPIVALGLPIFDTSMAILRRWFHRLPISSPDKGHIHHMLLSMGYTPRRAVLLMYLICVLLGGIALLITVSKRNEVVILLVGGLVIIVYVCTRIFAGMRFQDVVTRVNEDGSDRKRWKDASTRLSNIVLNEKDINNLDELWELSKPLFEALDLDEAKILLFDKNQEQPNVRCRWKHPDSSKDAVVTDTWSACITLNHNNVAVGQLVTKKTTTRSSFLRETPEILAQLKSSIERQITTQGTKS